MSLRLAGLGPELAADLSAVDSLVRSSLEARPGAAASAALELLAAGGKRLRPVLVLLSAQCGPAGITGGARAAAAAVELLHMASLVHDDVVDRAWLRRSRPTVNARFGDAFAVQVGDLLLAQALLMLGSAGIPGGLVVFAEAAAGMAGGELAQLGGMGRPRTLGTYLKVIYRKTGLLTGACCQLGGMAGGLPGRALTALAKYGRRLGASFQVGDDLLDVVGDAGLTGKVPGADRAMAVHTLPGLSHGERGFEHRARTLSALLAQAAQRALVAVPPSPARQALWDVAEDLPWRTA